MSKKKGYGLFLISQSTVTGYDTYDSAVVVAVDEEGARHISPSADKYVWHNNAWAFRMADGSIKPTSGGYSHSGSWCTPKDVDAVRIGDAGPNCKLGEVICASFNAG